MKSHISRGPHGSQAQEPLSLWSWGAPPFLQTDVLTTWSLSEPCLRVFITQSLVPLSSEING